MGPNLGTQVTDHLFPPNFLEVSHGLRNQKTPGLTSSKDHECWQVLWRPWDFNEWDAREPTEATMVRVL